MPTVQDVVDAANMLWPPEDAEPWDACGLAIGDPGAAVERVLLAVDASEQTIAEAVEHGAQMLFTHHPLLLHPTSLLNSATLKGTLITELLHNNVAQFAAHTNADAAEGGTSDVLAKALGLTDCQPIEPLPRDSTLGLGRVGRLPVPMAVGAFARSLSAILPTTARGVAVAGDVGREVQVVAICTGAGDSFLDHPRVLSADAYVTGDLRHHVTQDATQLRGFGAPRPVLIDVAHWASEWLWLPGAARRLADAVSGVTFEVSTRCTDPWKLVVPTRGTCTAEDVH